MSHTALDAAFGRAVRRYPQELHRLLRAYDLVQAGAVTLHPDHSATVRSLRSGKTYTCHGGACTCPDYLNQSRPSAPTDRLCYHRLAVCLHRQAAAKSETND